jgi:hypothetical protein
MKKIGLLFFVLSISLFLIAPSTLMACGEPDGCTPGYWKQEQHFDNWPTAGELCSGQPGGTPTYPQDCSFAYVFGVSPTISGLTLGEALDTGGGGENALGRHAVAALLNSYMALVDSSFDYCWTPIEVIEAVQDAYAAGTKRDFNRLKGAFEYDNEKNCPLN